MVLHHFFPYANTLSTYKYNYLNGTAYAHILTPPDYLKAQMVTLPHLRTSFRRGGVLVASHPPSIALRCKVHIDIPAWPSEEGYVTNGFSAALGPNQAYQFGLRTSRSMLIGKRLCSTRDEVGREWDFPSRHFQQFFIVIAPFSHK